MELQDRPLKRGVKVPTAIYTASNEPVCIVDSMSELSDDQDVAKRMVACWNACLGIGTNSLELMPGNYFGAIAEERTRLREQQETAVMPLIGPLLDAWDSCSQAVRSEHPELDKQLRQIHRAMEDAGDAQPNTALSGPTRPQQPVSKTKTANAGFGPLE